MWEVPGNSPLVDLFNSAGRHDSPSNVLNFFRSIASENNYLRFQDNSLSGDAPSTDKAIEKEMQELVKIGERLLKKPVSRVNKNSCLCQEKPAFFSLLIPDCNQFTP
ncbi:hypothetical protein AB3S75_004417 [Citrus x aurantiifolia]